MPVHNVEITQSLNKLADLLEIEGANVFRVRAYRNAANLVESLPRSVADMVAVNEDLSELPGIGKALDLPPLTGPFSKRVRRASR